MKQEKYSKRLKLLLALGAAWILLVAIVVGYSWPDLPKTKLGWGVLMVFGPPAYLVGESFFEWLFSQKHGKAISSKLFSWRRIFVALVLVVIIFGIGFFVSSLLPK